MSLSDNDWAFSTALDNQVFFTILTPALLTSVQFVCPVRTMANISRMREHTPSSLRPWFGKLVYVFSGHFLSTHTSRSSVKETVKDSTLASPYLRFTLTVHW